MKEYLGLLTKKNNIVIVGAGKIAYSLSAALIKAGYNINSVISRNKNSAKKLAVKFKIPFYYDDLESLPVGKGIFFLTVPDNQIAKVSEEISKLKLDFQNSLFIHLSGALNINELESLSKKKGNTASFHVMQTFPSKKIIEIKNCSAAIEAKTKSVRDFLMKLAVDLGLKPFFLKSDEKIYYHLAGVFASNFLVGNLSSSEKLFKMSCDNIKFLNVFNTIINATLDNVKAVGAAKALSGPVERGDYETIEKHLKALKKKDKILYRNYIVQSLNLLNVVEEKNGRLNKEQKKIKNLLVIIEKSSYV